MLFLGIAWKIYPAGMGKGDVKMVLMIGLALGKYVAVALFAAFAISTVFSAGVLLTQGLRGRKTTFPFGPFLAAGAMDGLIEAPRLVAVFFLVALSGLVIGRPSPAP